VSLWTLGGLVLLALGGWIAWVMHMAKVATTWPSTPGTVLAVWYDESHDDDVGDSFTPRIRYRYAVRGKSYEGKRLWYRVAPLRDYRESLHALRDINPGDAIDVFYDRDNPQRSVLFPGADAGNLLDLLSMLANLAMSIVARSIRR
jgi:hypothetical protein